MTDEILEKEAPFSKEVLGKIIAFLKPLPPPLTLVAHNGRQFDFPLLRKEIKVHSPTIAF